MLKNILLSRPLAILDLETTGKDVKEARIVEVSILKLVPGEEPIHRTKRVNPGMPIPPEATAVHKITDADVADCPPFSKLANGIVAFLDGCDLCGYNIIKYDLRLLCAELKRAGRELRLADRWIVDACRIFQEREKRNLEAAVRFYCGRDHDGAHGAAADVLATLAVLDGQVDRYQDLPRSIEELHKLFADPDAVDLEGKFKRVDGQIVFAFGQYTGKPLASVASHSDGCGYLEWILKQDFFDDVKSIVRAALEN